MKRVGIHDLKLGDVVLNSGMRILLDREIRCYDEDTKAFAGLVLNADALCTKGSEDYDVWIACHLRGQWYQDRLMGEPNARQDEWTVKSNSLAWWYVEEEGDHA